MNIQLEALVTDVHLRNALAGLRGLGRGGIRSIALAPSFRGAGLWSRFPASRLVGPDVLVDPSAFVDRVARVAVERGPLVVYPGREEALEALLGHRTQLPESVVLPYPEGDSVLVLRDKRRIQEFAGVAGLATPLILAEGTPAQLVGADVELPLVIKPAYPGTELGSARVIRSPRDYETLLATLPPSEELVLQEVVPGPLVSIELVLDRDGSVVARFQHSVRRTWPTEAGGIALSVSVAPTDELHERVASMLRAAGYFGLMQVQLLTGVDPPAVIDLNPRWYGPLPLALACGVNLPVAWHAVVKGRRFEQPSSYPLGVTYRRVDADLSAALNGVPELLFTRSPTPKAGAFWARDDPMPAAILTASSLLARIANVFRRRRHSP